MGSARQNVLAVSGRHRRGRTGGGPPCLSETDVPGGLYRSSSGLSDGTVRILALTILPYLRDAPRVICLEEPGNHTHPRAIEIVLQSLSSLYDSQVWISTHSSLVLAHTDLKSVIVMRGDPEGNVVAVAGSEHPQLRDW